MAVRGTRVTVGTSAVAILRATKGSHPGHGAVIKNIGSVAVDLGGSGVTTGNGFPLPADASITLELEPEEVVYAITGSSTTLALLEGGV